MQKDSGRDQQEFAGTDQSRAQTGVGESVYESIVWNSEGIAVAKLSSDWHILEANSAFRMVTGIENPVGRGVVELVSADDAESWLEQAERMRVEAVFLHYVRGDGDLTTLRSRLHSTHDFEMLVGEIPVADMIVAEGVMRSLNNEITVLARENARNSKQLKATLHELDASYWHLKKIQEVLPICMYCNKVKSEVNHWEDVAEYLKKNSLFLSHGLCPTCAPRYGK